MEETRYRAEGLVVTCHARRTDPRVEVYGVGRALAERRNDGLVTIWHLKEAMHKKVNASKCGTWKAPKP